jgi:uncharacterized protein (DUF779 family)
MVERVLATDETLKLIERLRAKHGPLMFHQTPASPATRCPATKKGPSARRPLDQL